GRNKLIEELQISLKKTERECKKKRLEIERLETRLEASNRAITDLVEQQQRQIQEMMVAKSSSLAPSEEEREENMEEIMLLKSQLEEKHKLIEDLNNQLRVTAHKAK